MLTRYRELQPRALKSMMDLRASKLMKHREGRKRPGAHWSTLTGLSGFGMELLMTSGPERVREELGALGVVAMGGVADFIDAFGRDEPVPHRLLDQASSVCMMQVVGVDVGGDPLPALAPYLVRVDTNRSDEFVGHHWNRALLALILDDPRTWRPIAGFAEDDAIPFVPRRTFEFNVQGLVAHLAGAIVHRGLLEDVIDAWRDFVRCFPALVSARQANNQTLLWIGRVVFHHIGGEPLAQVGAQIHEAVAAAEAG
jgi:hypothetical protein